MAESFRVLVHRNSDSLHLRLEGDFDEEAALQVVWMIGENRCGAGRIFIHTNGLSRIFPVGQQVFQRQFPSPPGNHVSFIFTGDKAVQIAPQGHRVLV
jgi:hypothetical protein